MRKICKDDTWMTRYQQHPTCLIAHCLLAWRNPHLRRSANTEVYLEPVALQNTTMQPFNQCSNSKLKQQEWCWHCMALPLFGVLALEHGFQWSSIHFNPITTWNILKRHFASFCDIVWVNECDALRSSHIRCQATAFSLCPLAVSLHSQFLRCRLKIPGSDWLVPVWTAQYGNKVPQVGWTDRDVTWCYMMLRHPDLRPVCRCLKTHHFVQLSFWKIQDPFLLLSISDQVTKVDQLGTNSSDQSSNQ